MRRFNTILISLILTILLFVSPAASFWWDDALVTIDGTRYTTENFKRWWQFWNDADQPLPETPDLYIDWLLLAREGERMRLDEDPAFQRKTEVFLKVRSLLMLQQEEIFSKIKISEDDLLARYEKLYTPIWLLVKMEFPTEGAAQSAWKGLNEATMTLEELKALPENHGGPSSVRVDWRRPIGINEKWAEIFKELEVGESTEPIEDLGYFVLYYLQVKEDGDDKDFEKLRKTLQEKIEQEKRAKLTADLLTRLQEKFEVQVDQNMLADLDLNKPLDAYSDEPVIRTNRRNFSEKEFMTLLQQDQGLRQSAAHNEVEAEVIKKRVLSGIISQNLTDWEALDRHYEEKEPFKWEYQFNIRHRLTNAVQNRLFAADVSFSEAEIEDYYKEHISRFTQPEFVDLVLIKDIDGAVDRVWGEIAAGKDFFTAVRENTEQKTSAESLPFQHLDPAVQNVVSGMTKGETSQPFENQGHRFIVYLTNRTPAKPLPLEKVSENIRTVLAQKKIIQQRKEYLDLLKSRSEIKVSKSNWQTIQKELGGTK